MKVLSLDSILNKVDELPELPQTALEVLKIVNDPESTLNDLSEVVCKDQGLTAKLLKLCNSAFYGVSRRISTVTEAVGILGFNTVKSIVLMATTHNTLNKTLVGYALKQGELWEHSLYTAQGSKYIATLIGYQDLEEAFIGGLLHDIGKIILNQYALTEVFKAVNLSVTKGISLIQAENEVIGFDHAVVGSSLAERWNFPSNLVNGIRYHHQEQELNDIFPAIICLANSLITVIKKGINEASYLLIPLNVLKYLGFSDLQISELLQNLNEEIDKISALKSAIA